MKYVIILVLSMLFMQDQVHSQIVGTSVTKIAVEDSCPVLLPTAFTPNSDGVNDRLRILCKCPLEATTLEVYNRWGDLIFTSNETDNGWDGTIDGALQPSGTYVYVVRYRRGDKETEDMRIKQGTLALLR